MAHKAWQQLRSCFEWREKERKLDDKRERTSYMHLRSGCIQNDIRILVPASSKPYMGSAHYTSNSPLSFLNMLQQSRLNCQGVWDHWINLLSQILLPSGIPSRDPRVILAFRAVEHTISQAKVSYNPRISLIDTSIRNFEREYKKRTRKQIILSKAWT